jgi:hypothetical protein
MSKELQQDHSPDQSPEAEQRYIRRFLLHLYATSLLLSIPASVIIAILTKNALPWLIPAPLLLAMHPMIRWAFSLPSKESQVEPSHENKIRQIRKGRTIP